jgi:hypothetical protein
MVNYTRNLHAHERKFAFNIIPQENTAINFPYSLLLAIHNNYIKQPCVVIHADMVLVDPIPEPQDNIVFSGDPFWPISVKQDGVDLSSHIKTLSEQKTSLVAANGFSYQVSLDILPMGGVYSFKNVPPPFFERVVRWSMFLSNKWTKDKWQHVCRSAFMLTMFEFLGGLVFRGANEYEMTMLDNKAANFVHYTKGLPPLFNKKMFTFEPPLGLATAPNGPYEILAEQDLTSGCSSVQKVVKSYQANK